MHNSKLVDVFLDNINYLFDQQTFPNKIAVAVSGGVDSVALAYLVNIVMKTQRVDVTLLNVDHNLRDESKKESLYVSELAKEWGQNFVPCSWSHEYLESGIQEKARDARYKLMTDVCLSYGIKILLVGHHLDDFIENFLLRQSRKSGILGLSSAYNYFYQGVMIMRPLYNIKKKDLENLLVSNSIKWYEDSSNLSTKYQRNKLRKEISLFSSDKLMYVKSEMDSANYKAELFAKDFINALAESVSINNFGVAYLYFNKYILWSSDIKIQIIMHILTAVSGRDSVPRYRNIAGLMHELENNQNINRTLHWCRVKKVAEYVIMFYKEPIFVTGNVAAISNNSSLHWDGRFILKTQFLEIKNNTSLFVGNILEQEYAEIKKEINFDFIKDISHNNYHDIIFTLPAIKSLEKIVAIPHMSYYGSDLSQDQVRFVFKPNFVSRFTHYF